MNDQVSAGHYKSRLDPSAFNIGYELSKTPCISRFSLRCPIDQGDVFRLCSSVGRSPNKVKLANIRYYENDAERDDLASNAIEQLLNVGIDNLLDSSISGKSFGLIINNALSFSWELRDRVSAFLRPFMRWGNGHITTFDLAVLIGNYKHTPFGVHLDNPLHYSLLYDLGPGRKAIDVWPAKAIYDEFGEGIGRIHDPCIIKAEKTRYPLGVDSPLMLPPNFFHVGIADGVSITVTMLVERESLEYSIMREARQLSNHFKADDFMRDLTVDLLTKSRSLRIESTRGFASALAKISSSDRRLSPSLPVTLDLSLIRFLELGHTIVYSNGHSSVIKSKSLLSVIKRMMDSYPNNLVDAKIEDLIPSASEVADAVRDLMFLIETDSIRLHTMSSGLAN